MNKKIYLALMVVVLGALVLVGGQVQAKVAEDPGMAVQMDDCIPCIDSLSEISIEGLRSREFGSTVMIEEQIGDDDGTSEYSQFYGEPYYNTYMASYSSDDLHVYSRVDIPPTEMPEEGYPVIIFAHGWVGASPNYNFNYVADAYYGDMLDAWVKAGYVVLVPGYRGVGTVNGVTAEGAEWIDAYDNGSYLSPIFYAVDILNLLDSVETLNDVDWNAWGIDEDIKVNTRRIFLTAHSQGGDAAATAMAISSSPYMVNSFAAGSIWSGSIQGPVEQGAFFGPQERSADSWTDPAYFPHMPSWWSPDWSPYTIEEGLAYRKAQMYDTIKMYVADQADADPETNSLVPVMATLSSHNYPQYYTAPIDFHYSDMDHYSIPEWNETLVRKIRMMGTESNAYLYAGNSHEFDVIEGWSPDGSVSGREPAIESTIALFDNAPDSGVLRTIDVSLIADTWVNGGAVSQNNNDTAVLTVRPTGLDNAFLVFDRGMLPADVEIQSATLTVSVSDQSGAFGKTLAAFNSEDIDATTVTFTNAPAIYNPSAAVAVPDAGGVISFDVTENIAAWNTVGAQDSHMSDTLAISSSGTSGRVNLDALETWNGSPATLTVTYTD